MKKSTIALFSLLLCGIAFSASAQNSDPVLPATGTRTAVHHNRPRLRHPEPPPAGGFWVSEDNSQQTSPVIVRYYDDLRRELGVDTLRQNRINLKSRAVVSQLNAVLAGLLQNRQQPLALAPPN